MRSRLFFQFQEALPKLPAGTRVAVAVSGGPDSVALLDLLLAASAQKRWRVAVVHVQHALRGADSRSDERFVRDLCVRFGVECVVQAALLPPKFRTAGLEGEARRRRYAALASVAHRLGARALLTGHTADDQAETFLLNLLRGAGPDGLCGIAPVRPLNEITGNPADAAVAVLRPLLGVHRREILAHLREKGLRFRRDRTNRLLQYRRNWVRHRLLPLMSRAQPRIARRLGELTAILRQEKAERVRRLERMARSILRKSEKDKNKALFGAPSTEGTWLDLGRLFKYDIYLRTHFLHRLMPQCSFSEICRMEERLKRRKSQGRFFLLSRRTSAPGAHLPSVKKTDAEIVLKVPGKTILPGWNLEVVVQRSGRAEKAGSGGSTSTARFDLDKLGGRTPWTIRSWKPGDRFQPFGMRGRRKKIQDYFVDAKVPRERRGSVPLLEVGGKIRWVVGYRTDDESRIGPSTRHSVAVRVRPL